MASLTILVASYVLFLSLQTLAVIQIFNLEQFFPLVSNRKSVCYQVAEVHLQLLLQS